MGNSTHNSLSHDLHRFLVRHNTVAKMIKFHGWEQSPVVEAHDVVSQESNLLTATQLLNSSQYYETKSRKLNSTWLIFCRYCSLAPIDLAAVLHFLENAEEVLYIDLSLNKFGDLGAKEVKKFIVNRAPKLKRLSLEL